MLPSPEPPPIAAWVRWLADAPAVFDAPIEGFPDGVVRVRAVLSDLYDHLGARAPAHVLAKADPADTSPKERDRLRALLHACRALRHPSLAGASPAGIEALIEELRGWSLVVGEKLGSDERREELARRCLRAVGRRPGGESEAEAEDRLRQVDAVERARVLRAAAEREKRAREVREALARAAEEEAAARLGRE